MSLICTFGCLLPPHVGSPLLTALNDATESVVQRTLYDKVYFQHELEEAIKREMKKDKVTQADIRRMYQRVSGLSILNKNNVVADIYYDTRSTP